MDILISQHAIQQMFKRNIHVQDVKALLYSAEVIKEYPNDKPYPSKLLLGYINDLPLHIVVAYNNIELQTIIVTAYIPDKGLWSKDFRNKL